MWFTQLNLIRYMIVCRVNSSLVFFPHFPSVDLSIMLGHAIADRVSVTDARKWHKSLSSWEQYGGISFTDTRKFKSLPPNPWPVEAVLFTHMDKRNYGNGELIFFEIKLMGDNADHGFFLEAILPSFEEIGHTKNKRWQYNNCMWGNFDIHSVYAAKGEQWEPLVKDGCLDLKYNATPVQWAEGLDFSRKPPHNRRDSIHWTAPFEFQKIQSRRFNPPSLKLILNALIERITVLLSGKHPDPEIFWSFLNEKEQAVLKNNLLTASRIPVLKNKFVSGSQYLLERKTGTQTFSTLIPDSLCPYLTLASIFHIGNHTHFGFGTFIID